MARAARLLSATWAPLLSGDTAMCLGYVEQMRKCRLCGSMVFFMAGDLDILNVVKLLCVHCPAGILWSPRQTAHHGIHGFLSTVAAGIAILQMAMWPGTG